MENGSQNGPGKLTSSDLFGDLFATFSEGRLFDAFWLSFGSLLAPFGRPLAPIGALLAPFRFLFGVP